MVVLIPSLVRLRQEFNLINPERDKASDGWIGDAAHQANPTSDHNPDLRGLVHAIDMDEDLRTPGVSMERCVQFLLDRCRSGQEKRLKYIIYERRIWSASNGWRQKAYTGSNPHDKHAHFSGSYEPAREINAGSYGLATAMKGTDMPLTDAELDQIEARAKKALRDVLSEASPTGGGSPFGALTTLLARTNVTTNVQLPALAAAVADRPEIDLSAEDIADLAGQVVEGMSDEMAEVFLDKLKARLEA
jgi:hypothetical protein